eukprot:438223_1
MTNHNGTQNKANNICNKMNRKSCTIYSSLFDSNESNHSFTHNSSSTLGIYIYYIMLGLVMVTRTSDAITTSDCMEECQSRHNVNVSGTHEIFCTNNYPCNGTITCPTGKHCDIRCNGQDSVSHKKHTACYNTTFICGIYGCTVNCIGQQSCQNSTFRGITGNFNCVGVG